MNEPTGRLPTTRPSGAHLTEVVLILWLVVLCGALWQDYGIGNLVFGLVLLTPAMLTLAGVGT